MRWIVRLASRISVRLLAFNLLLVFLPVAGVYYLDVYERQLRDAQERAMVQEGRVLSAALSERGPLTPAAAEGLLARLRQQSEARMRVVGPDGRILADSSVLGPRREDEAGGVRETREPTLRDDPRYRLGAWLYRRYERWLGTAATAADPDPADAAAPSDVLRTPEIREALAGRYGARTRMSPGGRRSVTLYGALPVWDGGRVVGAVQVSQSTARLFRALDQTRLGIFQVFLASVAVAAVLSLLVSTPIVRPLRRLRDESHAILVRRGRIRRRFGGSRRRDEIGELARDLEELTRRLEDHARFTESFAGDLSHELKNPLASIRAASEVLADVDTPAERRRFLDIVQREVARMEHLLAVSRELARVDAGIETEERQLVELEPLLVSIVESYRLRVPDVRIELVPAAPSLRVRGAPERLTAVMENVLDNALSFSPLDGTVRVELARRDGAALVTISDEGPGIPAGSEELVFTRFYTYRPGPAKSEGHTGLGLALVKAIVEGYGGTVGAATRLVGGAIVSIELPLA